jgi:hypothetical protein
VFGRTPESIAKSTVSTIYHAPLERSIHREPKELACSMALGRAIDILLHQIGK